MRLTSFVCSLLVSLTTPVLAQSGQPWPPEAPIWSADLFREEGQTVYSTRLTLTQSGQTWRVHAECEVGNPKVRTHTVYRGQGALRLSGGVLRGRIGTLGDMVIDQSTVRFTSPLCTSGQYNLGTGD